MPYRPLFAIHLLLCLALLSAWPAVAQIQVQTPGSMPIAGQAQPEWPQNWPALVEEVQQRVQHLGVDYAELVIFDGERILERQAFGPSAGQQPPPVRAGEVSEILTALAVMRLVERGEWTLFDSVRDRLPQLDINNPYQADHPLLLIHLLEHASGIQQRRFKSHFATNETVGLTTLERLHREQSPITVQWAPGDASRYSAVNYMILAAMLEQYTRQPWAETIAEQVQEPLGLANTYLGEIAASEVSIEGFKGLPADVVPVRGRTFAESEGSWMNVDDLAALGQFLISRGSSSRPAILRADTLATMELPRSTLASDAGLSYGMGIGLDTRARYGLWHGRQASLDGYSVHLRYHSQRGIGYALVVNHENVLPALDEPVWQYLAAQRPNLPTLTGGVSIEPRWEGWYRLENPQHAIFTPLQKVFDIAYLRRDGANLTLQPLFGPDIPLRSIDGSRLAHRSDGTIVGVLFSDETGNQRMQVHQDVRQRVSGLSAWGLATGLGLSLLILITHPFYRYESLKRPWGRRYVTFALLSLVLAAFVAGSLTLEQATSANWRNMLLFLFTAMVPLFAAAGLTCAILAWRHEANFIAKLRALVGGLAASAIAIWLIYSGWFALRLWSW